MNVFDPAFLSGLTVDRLPVRRGDRLARWKLKHPRLWSWMNPTHSCTFLISPTLQIELSLESVLEAVLEVV
jgi:hypothetical protein